MRDIASVGGGCGGLGFGLVRNHVWPKFVAETCSCVLRIVNSISANT